MKTKYKYLLLSTALISHNAQAWFGSSWGSDIESAVSSAATSVVSTVTNVASDAISIASTAESDIASIASTVGSDVASAASDVATFVVNNAGTIEDIASAIGTAALIASLVIPGVDAVTGPVLALEVAGDVADAADVAGTIAEGTEAVVDGAGAVGDATTTTGEMVGNLFDEGTSAATDTASTGASTASTAVSTVTEATTDAKSILEGIEHAADVIHIGTAIATGSPDETLEGSVEAGLGAALGSIFSKETVRLNFTKSSPMNQLASRNQLSPKAQLAHKRITHKINKLRKLVPEASAPGAEMAQHSNKLANQTIASRIGGVLGLAFGSGEGVAAGDNSIMTKPGIWLNAIGGKAVQGSPDGRTPGYKMTTVGFTLGGDAVFENNWLGGAAVTYSNALTKYTKRKLGNKSMGKSVILALYGSYTGWENWVINATASYGYTRTTNKSLRLRTSKYEIATAKFNTNMYALNTNIAYTHRIANINTAVIPNVGLQYSSFNQAGYKETGTIAQNLTFGKMRGIAQGIVAPGLTLRKENIVISDVQIIPEILGYVNYSFYKKSPNVRATTFSNVTMVNSGTVLASQMQKRDYNFGGNITAKTKQLEFTIGCLATVVKKYKAYQGSLKLRINL